MTPNHLQPTHTQAHTRTDAVWASTALHAWLRALAGVQEFETTVRADITIWRRPLLKLNWHDALAEQLVQRNPTSWNVGFCCVWADRQWQVYVAQPHCKAYSEVRGRACGDRVHVGRRVHRGGVPEGRLRDATAGTLVLQAESWRRESLGSQGQRRQYVVSC